MFVAIQFLGITYFPIQWQFVCVTFQSDPSGYFSEESDDDNIESTEDNSIHSRYNYLKKCLIEISFHS